MTKQADARLAAIARTLSNRNADACSVDRDDHWKIYSESFRADAHAVLETSGVGAMAQAYENLDELCGYWQDGSDQVVTISQDDATRSYVVTVGKNSYSAQSLKLTIAVARLDARST